LIFARIFSISFAAEGAQSMALGVHERGASQKQVTSVTSGNEVKIQKQE